MGWLRTSSFALAAAAASVCAAPAAADPMPVEIHGFVSEGGFYSTDNDYIGHSSRGSLEFFQTAINVSSELSDKMRAGLQLFSQDEGRTNDPTPRLDWAYLDYRWQEWLGIRAGRVRIPFGLYNDYVDIDAARAQILLPQSIYPIADRNILTAQTGVALYGSVKHRCWGTLEYQGYAGVLSFPLPAAQNPSATAIYGYDSRYLVGMQATYRPNIEGLRVGASLLRTSLDYDIHLGAADVDRFVQLGLAPPGYDGNLTLAVRPATLWIVSAEYARDDWMVSAEYSRWFTRSRTSPVNLLPDPTSLSERFYGMATYRLLPQLDTSVYYSVLNSDVDDRHGHDRTKFAQNYYAWSRDAAASLRYDFNEHWLAKAEAHFIDGAAANDKSLEPMPTRYWWLFLVRTTVTF